MARDGATASDPLAFTTALIEALHDALVLKRAMIASEPHGLKW
jgi:hypothetical protein